ncbi:MAG: SpoIIE family protein phosphatase [Woeseia sp.]|nr:SpoIIE family protein phosphatase [Woeseia sp.]
MPGMTGIEFCRGYRSLAGAHEGYFILLTAQTEREVLAEGLENGADDFLSKPVSTIELRARLKAGERILNAQRALSAKNAQLTDTLGKLTDAYSSIDRDLEQAKKFQEMLVPARRFSQGSTDISLMFRPSGHVGGDMVGYFPVRDGEIGLFAVDVSGHGVSSALMTARIMTYFSSNAPDRNIALIPEPDGYAMDAPDAVCNRLNALLCNDGGSDHYLTMILAHMSVHTGKIRLCQAGHPSPAIVRVDGKIELQEVFGMPIGLVENAEFEISEVYLQAGEKLLIYSDGIPECPDNEGLLIDDDGLISAIHRNRALRGTEFLDGIIREVERHRGSQSFPDDLSAVLIERR